MDDAHCGLRLRPKSYGLSLHATCMLAHRPSHRVRQQRPRSAARLPLLRRAPLLEIAALSSGSPPGARAPRDVHGCPQLRGSRHSCTHQQHDSLHRIAVPPRPPSISTRRVTRRVT
eukprot:1537048-Pleurochrysis_carterae.AAC.2